MILTKYTPVGSMLAIVFCTISGCATSELVRLEEIQCSPIPRELDKATLADYVVEPPDILNIQAAHTLRSPNSLLAPGDRLQIQLRNGVPFDAGVDLKSNPLQSEIEAQIELEFKVLSGLFRVGGDGAVDLGPIYGKVPVAGLTIAAANAAVREHLMEKIGLKSPELSVTLEDIETPQPISGQHLVRPDGRISLGIYGDLLVAGMSLPAIRESVKQTLEANGIVDPKVAVDVAAYNSKLFYVITDGGGYGENVVRLPYTGNETVLDAISQIQGLPEISSKRMWIARPGTVGSGTAQILEVAWEDIAALGQSDTNFQIMPGDRIYIQADKWIAFDNYVEKVVSPFERIFGVSILGFNAIRYSKAFYPIAGGAGGGFF
jgi:protein involved in polysaccharide export with SLBB domain